MKRTTLPRVLVLIALASIMAHGQVIDADSSGPDMVSGVQAEGNGSVYISLFRSTGDQHAPVAMLEVKGSLWFNSIGIVGSLDGLQSLGFAKDKTQSIAEGVPLQWLKITARSLVQGKALVTTEDGNSYIIFNLGGFSGQIGPVTPGTPPPQAQAASSYWTDPATGLMWTKQDNGSDINWNDTTTYCANLRMGGYSGWRLPTIDELAGIYDQTQNVNGRHIKGDLQLFYAWVWSSNTGKAVGEAWLFGFANGGKESSPVTASGGRRALCVRLPPKGETAPSSQTAKEAPPKKPSHEGQQK